MTAAPTSTRNRLTAGALAAIAVGALAVMLLHDRHERSALAIRLRWIRSHDAETWSNVQTGLLWTLSFLGARLEHPLQDIIVPRGGDASIFELRLDQAGFTSVARRPLAVLLARMKETHEYRRDGAFDLGRFVTLTLGNSWRDRKSTRLNSSHSELSRMPSSA